MHFLLDIFATAWGNIMALLAGGLAVAVFNYFVNRNKMGAETGKTMVETSQAEQRLIEDRIEFLTKQATAYKTLYDDISERYKLLEQMSSKKEGECEKKIEEMQLQINKLQDKVAQLTAQAGLK